MTSIDLRHTLRLFGKDRAFLLTVMLIPESLPLSGTRMGMRLK
jgi:hypothetical protein